MVLWARKNLVKESRETRPTEQANRAHPSQENKYRVMKWTIL